MDSTHMYEITVIGGGPVGMFAAFYAGLRSADVLLIESLSELGGQPFNLYPAKVLYDIAGYPAINGTELTAKLIEQSAHFEPTIQTATTVTQIETVEGGYRLTSDQGDFLTKTVIIATGGGAFLPRKLAVDYDERMDGHQVNYFVRDLENYRDLDVAIAGGGDSAIDWALTLAPIAKSVHLIHRRNEFRALESSVATLNASTVVQHTPFLINAIQPEGPLVTLNLKEVRGDANVELTVDKLLVNYGFMSDNKQLKQWDLTLDRNLIAVDSQMQTSRAGIYAIGDAVNYPGKLQLIASGFGEAPTAVNDALSYLYPDRRAALHSSQLYH
ncbi:NAD(P)/FAD-dependent oxidoreductase [Lacticaseibacillus brantae]|nr:NAD(P)/FAD-dependent oxidoreductase [Lacticaseibacillus brantae]